MSNPLDSGFHQAGPQSPFQAPLFVRDRYGSADSTNSLDEVEPKSLNEDDTAENPWAGVAGSPAIEATMSKQPKSELPPVDRGFKAWSILAGAFLFEALIWGFPLSFGVFQNYYFTADTPFKGNTSVPLVGVFSTGIFFLGAPLMTYFTEKFPKYRRQMIWAGWPLCVFSLLAGSFAQTMPALIATQGVMYSIGELILYLPLMSIINEWFIERRGLAYGIVTCSTGITGIALPFLTEVLLTRLGYQTTLRIFTIILAVITGPLLLLLKPRLPPDQLPTTPELSLSFLRNPLFWLYSFSNTAHSLALFLPTLFLPQFASALGLSATLGALLLALLAVGQILGQLTFGYLSDRSASDRSFIRIPLNVLVFLSSFLAGIAALTLWGLAHSLLLLAFFAVAFGFAANGYVVLWARMGLVVTDNEPSGVLATFGLFSFQKGIGNMVAGPISSVLVGVGMQVARDKMNGYGADGQFAAVVVFCGGCMILSSLIVGVWYVLPRSLRSRFVASTQRQGGEEQEK